MNQQQQQSQLKQLIAKGKEQGYLTYAEVNDHLPDSIVEPEQIEDIIRMINDMGISVHESAPDADDHAISDKANSADDDAAEAAAAALANVDSEFGRTTDPVRMYMREMGTVELLTREGELKIAKRIEEGLRHVLSAISTYPETITKLLGLFALVKTEEKRLTDIISGFIDPNEPDEIAKPNTQPDIETDSDSAADTDDDEDATDTEEVEDTGPDPEEAEQKRAELEKRFKALLASMEKNGKDHATTAKAVEKVTETFLEFKLLPAVFNLLVDNMRDTIALIRSQERAVMDLCVQRARMPRKTFITSFPENETDLGWIEGHINAGKPYSEALEEVTEEVLRAQKKLLDLESRSGLSILDIKEINRMMSIGEAKARRAKKEMV